MSQTNVEEGPARVKRPDWLRVKLPTGESFRKVRQQFVSEHKLHTTCQSGNCPNMGECWGAGTATFMILGNICTRSCGFCSVATGKPENVDPRAGSCSPQRGIDGRKALRGDQCGPR